MNDRKKSKPQEPVRQIVRFERLKGGWYEAVDWFLWVGGGVGSWNRGGTGGGIEAIRWRGGPTFTS